MASMTPLTAGFDWEVGVYRPGLGVAKDDDIDALARGLLKAHPAAGTGREWCYLEQRSGILTGFGEVVARTERMLNAAHQAAAEAKLRLGPMGTLLGGFGTLGCHVHVGCLPSFGQRQEVANALAPYLPALTALTVHSPLMAGRAGEYKSYRMAWHPWDVGPVPPIAVATTIDGAWGDLCSDRDRKPTIEVRVADSPGCARLVAEYVALLAGFLAVLAESDEIGQAPERPEERLLERIENRHEATRHGLQATFAWGGGERSAADLLGEMIDRAEPGLRRFGTSGAELTVIARMLERRQTQADLLLALRPFHDDPVCYAEACLQVLRRPAAFETWLETAPELPSLPRQAAEERLWECIGTETHLDSLRHRLRWPPAVIERRLEAWQAEGRVRIEATPLVGYVVSRSDRAAVSL